MLVYNILQQNTDDPYAYQERINSLIELNENHRRTFDHLIEHQDKVKEKFVKNTLQRQLQIRDLVLLWDKRREDLGKHGKFDSHWLDPYQITDVAAPNAFHLSHMYGENIPLPVNGKTLKSYFSNVI